MKIAIITDTHWGARNDSITFIEHFRKFHEDIFFPTCEEYGVDTCIHLGDLNDRRKFINYISRNALETHFMKPIRDRNIELHMILGNHDTYYKNTNEINGVRELYGGHSYDKYHIYEHEPVELQLGSSFIMLSPWITKNNYEVSLKAIKETNASILMGHFEIAGIEMMKGHLCDHGLDAKLFKKFEAVYSGHFHHPSEYNNIKYLGAPYEMNWTDFNGKRGFHIFDTETKELTFIENPYKIFHKLYYDDREMTLEGVSELDFSPLENAYVKVIVHNKENPYIYDVFMDRLNQFSPADVKAIEDTMHLEDIEESELIDEAQDTLTILSKYVDDTNTTLNKAVLKKEITNLYNEAMSL